MTERVYISDLAREVDRRESTIRAWCRSKRLPTKLRPRRDGDKGWRYWTVAQVLAIKEWMRAEGMAPGSGLSNFRPTQEQTDELLAKLRQRSAA